MARSGRTLSQIALPAQIRREEAIILSTASPLIRVLVVDDLPIVRTTLRTVLGAFDDLQVVGQAASGEEAVRLCTQSAPDVVLMDLVMPGMGGIEAIRTLRAQCPAIQIVALTNYVEWMAPAVRAGAARSLLKDTGPEQIAAAIRDAYAARPSAGPPPGGGTPPAPRRFNSAVRETPLF